MHVHLIELLTSSKLKNLIYLGITGGRVSNQGRQVPAQTRISSGRISEDVGADLREGQAQLLGGGRQRQDSRQLAAALPQIGPSTKELSQSFNQILKQC